MRRAAWLVLLAALLSRGPADAANFTWATDGDVGAMDPDTRDETVQLSFLSNIYEPLLRRNRTLGLEPALAESWEQINPTVWRFHLRHGVQWQNGSPFTAEDVVFSWQRLISKTSMMRAVVDGIHNVAQIDPFTVDIVTDRPMPVLLQQLTTFLIMSKAWCEKHNAISPVLIEDNQHNYAVDHAMGTGPFRLQSRERGRQTVLERAPGWWDVPKHNLDRAELDVIANPAKRVEALLSGKVDMLYAVPPESVDRLSHAAGIRLIESPELRTIYLGMAEADEKPEGSAAGGPNPFNNRLVREAVLLAIDEPAIVRDVMHGQAHPTWMMWGPGINGYDAGLDHRPAPDPAKAKLDLMAAGYPNGFTVKLDCPNNRYVNDAAICRTVVSMLARVGITVNLDLEDKAAFFGKIGPPHYRASFFLLGWTPSTYDALDTLVTVAATRKLPRGLWNCGGYSNPALDRLIDKIGAEFDPVTRNQEIDDAARILQQDIAFIPLHQQVIVWAVGAGISLAQPADDYLPLRYVQVSAPAK